MSVERHGRDSLGGGAPKKSKPDRFHRILLGLHPRAFRRELGPAIEDALAQRAQEARSLGAGGRMRVWARESAGLLSSAAREWSSRLRGTGTTSTTVVPTGQVARLPAAAVRELRHALRRLRHSPGFTAAAVLTLGLGLGATAAIFAVVERVVISPLPYPDANRVVYLDHGSRSLDRASGLAMSSGLYWQYSHRARTLTDVAIYQPFPRTITGEGEPETAIVTRATPSFARTLGVTPALGRWLDETEGVPGAAPVVVLSNGLWTSRFGEGQAALGRTLVLDGAAHEIVGVMPRGFDFPNGNTEAWVPLPLNESTVRAGGFNFGGVARMAEGATVEEVRSELDALIARVPQDLPGDPTATAVVEQAQTFSHAILLKQQILGATTRNLWLLLGAVGLVLLVACANVANLFLVRVESRQGEVSVRRALGAGNAQVAGFYLAEAGLLALLGGTIGTLLAGLAVELLVTLGPPELPRLREVRFGGASMAFIAALALAVTAALGAVALSRPAPPTGHALREGGRGSTQPRARLRGRHLMMAGQVASALVLLVGAALLLRSFERIRSTDPGYDPEGALLVRLILPGRTYPSRAAAAALHESLLERVRALPGVTDATATTCPPLSSYCFGDPVSLPERPWTEGEIPPVASFRRVADRYFETMGIRLRSGRTFEETDHRVATRVTVIDDRMAELYFPGEEAVGRRLLTGGGGDPYEVIGVVEHVPVEGITSPDRPPQVYLPLLSHTTEGTPSIHPLAFVIRADGAPQSLVPAVRGLVAELDADLPLAEVTTLEDMLAQERAPMAFTMTLILIAGLVALALGLVGVYGVLSFAVATRTAEIGVRLALGGHPRAVARTIFWQGARVSMAGLALGWVAAAAGSRSLTSMLYGVSPTEWSIYAVVTLALLVAALGACWIPARRAARLDPVEALRKG